MAETVPLSGSLNFAAIAVGAGDIESGTIIHTATNVPGEYDMVSLVAQNSLSRTVEITLCVPLLDPDIAVLSSVPPANKTVKVLEDFWMTSGAVLRAVASKDNTVTVKGSVTRQGAAESATVVQVPSVAPSGHFRVTNLYVDSATGKLITEYDDIPQP